jgi:hypothetical protein
MEDAQANLSDGSARTPFCCPVCGGNGVKDEGFYLTTTGQWSSTSIRYVLCKTCGGTGMVWNE